jgi:hypothetical protein
LACNAGVLAIKSEPAITTAMPISGPNSYPATMSAFIQHWTEVNTVLPTPLIVSGGRTVEALTLWLAEVESKLAQVTMGTIAAANRKGELDVIKENIISWCVIFNAKARADYATSTYVRNLVPAPGATAGRGAFMEPVLKTMQIWMDLNTSISIPLVLTRRKTLMNGTLAEETLALAQLQALLDALSAKWNEWTRAQQAVDNRREERNDLMKLAYDCMRDYRQKVPLELPAGHSHIDSLPALNPDPARNVTPPAASGAWNSGTQQADLAAVASPDSDIVRTELRFSPVAPYNADNEVVLASIPAGGTLSFSTDLGLAVSGDTSRFTWVAVASDGNEGRSGVVAVTRP